MIGWTEPHLCIPGANQAIPISYDDDRACMRARDETTKQETLRLTGGHMGNYFVGLEAAWVVNDVETIDDAIGIAVSEAGRRLNEMDLEYVEVDVAPAYCPVCGEPWDGVYEVAGTALVGLALEIEVYNVESREHAQRVAKSDIGGALKGVPLEVVETIELDGDEEA